MTTSPPLNRKVGCSRQHYLAQKTNKKTQVILKQGKTAVLRDELYSLYFGPSLVDKSGYIFWAIYKDFSSIIFQNFSCESVVVTRKMAKISFIFSIENLQHLGPVVVEKRKFYKNWLSGVAILQKLVEGEKLF